MRLVPGFSPDNETFSFQGSLYFYLVAERLRKLQQDGRDVARRARRERCRSPAAAAARPDEHPGTRCDSGTIVSGQKLWNKPTRLSIVYVQQENLLRAAGTGPTAAAQLSSATVASSQQTNCTFDVLFSVQLFNYSNN